LPEADTINHFDNQSIPIRFNNEYTFFDADCDRTVRITEQTILDTLHRNNT